MASGKFVSYIRVSTQQQGASGLGLEAQQAAVTKYLNGGDWQLLGQFVEVETAKGAQPLDKRPELRQALALCKKHGATLVIAKLDRLARNVHFITGLMETNVNFVAADMPHANKVMLQMHAVMAEWERDQISLRTKEALAAAKARGVKLGNPANLDSTNSARRDEADAFAGKLSGLIAGMKARGLAQRAMVTELNELGITTMRGKTWSLTQLRRVMARLN